MCCNFYVGLYFSRGGRWVCQSLPADRQPCFGRIRVSGMERTAGVSIEIARDAELLFLTARFYSGDGETEISLGKMGVEQQMANDITAKVTSYKMHDRNGRVKKLPLRIETLDDQPPRLWLDFGGGEVASLNDGYIKPDSFYEGYAKIRDLLFEIAYDCYGRSLVAISGSWTNDAGEQLFRPLR